MSIAKKYLSGDGVCKVTFTLPDSLAETAKTAHVVGEFNNWDSESLPMKKAKNGKFALSLELQKNNEYQFRYLVDGTSWETDWEADALAPVPFADEHNSVVKL
jgi:1,4-alpha-glucan branching enzyme